MEILILCDYYLPGYKGGGPINTISNLVECLGDEFHFRIVTRDRDYGDHCAYPDVEVNCWQHVGKAEVLYLTPDRIRLGSLCRVLRSIQFDVLYLNSVFSPAFTIRTLVLRRLWLISDVPVVLAVHGTFSPVALQIKAAKKRLYLGLARGLGLYRNLIWHFASEHEREGALPCIVKRLGIAERQSLAVVARPCLAHAARPTTGRRPHAKQAGTLKVVFLSRISRMKNLNGALQMLQRVQGEVQFDIYGPHAEKEDDKFWSECQKYIRLLPSNIKVEYRGVIKSSEVVDILADYDLFLLPTVGENFGHVVLEALLAGCPALISDRTPWRGLATKGVGWDLPLEQPEKFTAVLQECVDMDEQELAKWSRRARAFAQQYFHDKTVLEQTRALFREAVRDYSQ